MGALRPNLPVHQDHDTVDAVEPLQAVGDEQSGSIVCHTKDVVD